MTDNIKLPPLPKGDIAADTCPVMWVHSNEQLQAYAREAIEADRKRRGEPVAWIRKNGFRFAAEIEPQDDSEAPLYAAPQPTEPVELDRYDPLLMGGQDGMPAFVWHDIIRAELDRAYYFYMDQIDRAAPQSAEPVKCVACEGRPAPENNPCAVCGKDDEPVKVPSDDLAHEIWAAAQTAPGEGIEDAVARVAAILAREAVRRNAQAVPAAPQPAQPLTDAEIKRIATYAPEGISDDDVADIVRRVERMHGVGE